MFSEIVLPKLEAIVDADRPICKIDVVKYMTEFRRQDIHVTVAQEMPRKQQLFQYKILNIGHSPYSLSHQEPKACIDGRDGSSKSKIDDKLIPWSNPYRHKCHQQACL